MSLTPDGHPNKPGTLDSLGNSYQARFNYLGEVSDINEAIRYGARAVLLTREGHPGLPRVLNNLGASCLARFERLGGLPDLQQAVRCGSYAVCRTPDSHPDKPVRLGNLGLSYQTRYERLGQPTDIDEAIKFGEQAYSLTPDGHPEKFAMLNNLGVSYQTRFGRLGELSDLDKAIECRMKAVSLIPASHPNMAGTLYNLGSSYQARFERLGESSDIESATSSFRSAAQSPTGSPYPKFRACRQWARLSSYDATSPRHLAYHHAMDLLPQLIWIGTTVDRRYELVAEIGDFATEAASHAISTYDYDLALEWLEAGRSIVWGQLVQLRTPFDQLSSQNPELANALAEVGRRLEHAGSRSSSALSPSNGNRDLGQEANNHVQLALQWNKLLEDARAIVGFEDFLCTPKASRLLGVAKSHPIAVINLHQSRCDALILRPESKIISHIPLTQLSSKDAISVCHRVLSLVRERKPGPPLGQLGSLEGSLDSLWSSVVKPVLEFLGYIHKLPTDQLPHLTWCTTGLLSFLPLHAARSHDSSYPSAFDLGVFSYTPTLSALLANRPGDLSKQCGVLAIALEHTPNLPSLPCTKDELAVIKKHAGAGCYLQLEEEKATVDQVLDAMEQFSWAHMACHGSQGAADPTQSAFHLHDGGLTLAMISKRSFSNKGLAFLSACQTATGDKKMPDEAVHLAAGMLVAGYPSVIGTMWSIIDEDAPEVADTVYRELLKEGKMDHTKAARALHQAVFLLRAKVGEKAIERWAPFIHIGS